MLRHKAIRFIAKLTSLLLAATLAETMFARNSVHPAIAETHPILPRRSDPAMRRSPEPTAIRSGSEYANVLVAGQHDFA